MKCILLVGLLFVAMPASAAPFDWKPYMALAAGQSMDLVTTVHALNGSTPCHEGNPTFGPHPSTLKLAIPKLALIGGLSFVVRYYEKRDSVAGRRVAKTVAYIAGGLGATAGVHNIHECGW